MNFTIKVLTINKKNFDNIEWLLSKLSSTFRYVVLPKKHKKFVFLKSPHVNKKSKEHFKLTRYSRLYFVSFTSSKKLKFFLLSIPENVTLTIKKNTIL